jgi:predicted metal-dependent phosphoesterase TrpH
MQTSNSIVSRIYHSREDRIKDLHEPDEQLSYNEKDDDKIIDLLDVVDEYVSKLLDKIEEYQTALDTDEFNDEETNYVRREVIERWALAQAALSKVAWFFRIDGNTAYERMISAIRTGAAADMRGL